MSAYAIGIVSIFMAVGPALMILNKEILDKVDFRHPILVSSMGLVASGIFTHVLYGLGKLRLEHAKTVTLRFWVTRCLPVGVCHAATLAFGNAQYLFMGISSVQVLKSFTPIVTAGVTFVLLGRKESLRSSAALLALCVATATAARGDSSVTAFGLMLALAGSLAEATRLVMTDFLLSGVKMQVLESMYYLAPAGGLCLLALGTLLEGPNVVARGDQAKIWANPLVFLIAALLGVGVQLLTTAVIQATSATTLKVLSQVRNTIPVWYGLLIYREHIPANSLASYIAGLFAFGYYTYVKMQNSSKKASEPEQVRVDEDRVEHMIHVAQVDQDERVRERTT